MPLTKMSAFPTFPRNLCPARKFSLVTALLNPLQPESPLAEDLQGPQINRRKEAKSMSQKAPSTRQGGKGMESFFGQILVAAVCFGVPYFFGPTFRIPQISTHAGQFLCAVSFGPMLLMLVGYLRRRMLESRRVPR
jgi:hypothetical protein